ncbi:hypothetical protein C8A05DRAFT_14714 [Staphylotrichum tortipilum]|uniref:Protection of telomeres protein 1 n=1 Tax=Staphylotrichum tortipilum TaxID=2831512 RepID=A0AAN6RUT2_9PEZI|nr:hypothetical protein C8A05DRAFT_14714 [Staphylotrichum longicolle]
MAAAGSPAPPDRPLPAACTALRAIFDDEATAGSFVNVIGLVKDCQLPIPTNGSDYKASFELFDLSIQGETDGVKFVIFRPLADMPQVSVGDVMVALAARVQRFRADPLSLITNHRTSIRIYAASKIPKPPKSAQVALVPSAPRDVTAPMAEEHAYVSHLYHRIDKYFIPDEAAFQQKAEQSLNLKTKFSLLKDVQEGRFCDLVVQVAKEPHHSCDKATLYVSDYTENPRFYHHVWPGLDGLASAPGDLYGYTSITADAPKKDWVGPYGKMALQVSCFEPHASYVRDEVRAGEWVSLRNVQIKLGNNGQFLEGFLRRERGGGYERKVNVQALETHDRDTIDPNLKEAIRRMRDYGKKRKQQIKEIKASQAAGEKRNAFDSLEQQADRPPNTRDRRKRMRAAAQGQQAKEPPLVDSLCLELNDEVTAEVHPSPFTTITSILGPPLYETTLNNHPASLPVPFTCAKYRALVRVVDFFPPSLQDFASPRKPTVYDALSDNEDNSDVLSSDDDDDDDDGAAGTDRIWEWRFALQLEDPTPPPKPGKKTPDPPPRLWVLVDNADAQCLTGLNATDLGEDPQTLGQLRARMCTLWGNLEECKAREEKIKHGEKKEAGGQAAGGGRKGGRQLEKPPLESSDVEDDDAGTGGGEKGEAVSNKPFSCCIKQYGVKGGEDGREWVRCFGLFGTKIK